MCVGVYNPFVMSLNLQTNMVALDLKGSMNYPNNELNQNFTNMN